MKSKIALVLACVMVTGCFAGCGGNGSPATSASGRSQTSSETTSAENSHDAEDDKKVAAVDSFTIGAALADSGNTANVTVAGNISQIAELAGGSVLYPAVDDFSADGVISLAEQQIAAGVDGILVIPPADSVLPTIVKMCEDAGVYFGIAMRDVIDENIRDMVVNSEYFAGGCTEVPKGTGYEMGRALAEEGYKKIALTSTAVGTYNPDQREEGLREACEEFGMEIVAEARAFATTEDAANAVTSFLAAYPDLDCIIDLGQFVTGVTDVMVSTVEASGSECAVVGVMPLLEAETTVATGIMPFAPITNGKAAIYSDYYITTVMLVNAVKGTPIVGEDGKCGYVDAGFYMAYDPQEMIDYNAFQNDTSFRYFSDEYVQDNLFAWENKALDKAKLQEIYNGYDLYRDSPNYQ